MPELPDVEIYCESLQRFYGGRRVETISIRSPFVVRTFDPDISTIEGRRIVGFSRLGKRIVWEFEDELFLILHLMIAGRLHRKPPGKLPRSKTDLAAFVFGEADGPADVLMLTEASPKKRASVHLVEGRTALAVHDPQGIEPLDCTGGVRSTAPVGESHPQAKPGVAAALQRHRQRLQRRNPSRGAALANHAHEQTER